MSPENWWVENEISFENGPSSGDMLVFSGNIPHILTNEVSLPKPAPGNREESYQLSIALHQVRNVARMMDLEIWLVWS